MHVDVSISGRESVSQSTECMSAWIDYVIMCVCFGGYSISQVNLNQAKNVCAIFYAMSTTYIATLYTAKSGLLF